MFRLPGGILPEPAADCLARRPRSWRHDLAL